MRRLGRVARHVLQAANVAEAGTTQEAAEDAAAYQRPPTKHASKQPSFDGLPMQPLTEGAFAGRTERPHSEMLPHVTAPYNPMELNDYLVLDSWNIGPDTLIMRLAFPEEFPAALAKHLQCPSHVSVFAQIPGTGKVKHTYTVISTPDADGYFDLLIKGYDPSAEPDPSKKGGKALTLRDGTGGGLAWHTIHKKSGEYVELKFKKAKTAIGGQATGGYRANRWREVGMVGSGTGIAPFIQIIRTAVPDPSDQTRFSVLMCQRTEADLLLKDELDSWARTHPQQVQVAYTLTRPTDPESWLAQGGKIGRVSAPLLKKTMPAPAEDVIVLVCGTDEFRDAMAGPRNKNEPVIGKPGETKTGSGPVLGLLGEAGRYSEAMCYKF